MEEASRRPAHIYQAITGWFLNSNFYSVHITLVFAALFSLVAIILIHSFFERTHAPEILYISIFTVSFTFESFRLFLPLHYIFNFPYIYLLIMSRFLLFIRYFSIFSLFTAGICAAGLEVQKTRTIIFIITIAALIITIGVPIDILNWDTSLNIVNGYRAIFRMIELAAFLTTTISFFVAAKNRDTREYRYIAIGVILVFIGRNILLGTDNWLGPVPGIALLSIGTWLICSKLHKIYLWL